MCKNKDLLTFLYEQFDADANAGATQIFSNICKTLSRFVIHAFAVSDKSNGGGVNGLADDDSNEMDMMDPMGSLSPMTSSNSMRQDDVDTVPLGVSMDALANKLGGESSNTYSRTNVIHMKDRLEPPDIKLAAVVLCAHECSMYIVNALTLTVEQTRRMQPMLGRPSSSRVQFGSGRRLSSTTEELMQEIEGGNGGNISENSDNSREVRKNDKDCNEEGDELSILRGMTRSSWSPLNDMLEIILFHCTNKRLVHDVLRSYQTITNTCGVIELVQVRDTLISSLCRFALPPKSRNDMLDGSLKPTTPL